jgi:hypothetical protein
LRHKGIIAGMDVTVPIIAFFAAVGALILALGILALAGFLVAFIFFLVVVFLIQLTYIAKMWRPPLTRQGKETVRHLYGFREYVSRAEDGRIEWKEERGKGIHELTPFAVVFGNSMTWATKLQEISESLLDDII